MSPTLQSNSHSREPAVNGYESEYSGDTGSADDYFDEKSHQNLPSSHFYSDSEPKSRFTGRSSSGRRSRKTSSSGRELVRILLEEKADAEGLKAQLERAYGILRAESQRAAEAERSALETAERLKGTHRARVQAQQEATRLQSELRMYKIQYENAQSQLHRANEMITQSDLERERSERAVEKMRRNVDKLREAEVARRAMEEGRRRGREEVMRQRRMREVAEAVNRQTRVAEQFPIMEDGEDDSVEGDTTDTQAGGRPVRRSLMPGRNPQLQFPRNAPAGAPESYRTQSPLPVPPPESMPVMPASRNSVPANIAYRQQAADRSGYGFQNHVQPMTAAVADTDALDSRPVPDHIIIRSPLPVPASSNRSIDNATPRPPSSQASRPLSRAAMYPVRDSTRQSAYSQTASRRHAPSVPYDADAAAASAGRIYSHVSTDSPEFPSRPDSRMARSSREYGNGMGWMADPLPQPEEIVPLPAMNQGYGPARPPSTTPPVSAAALARSRRRVPSVTSSSTASSPVTETASVVRPSRIQQLRRSGRGWSSDSSVPGIIIEPPSRPESVETHATTTTFPTHLFQSEPGSTAYDHGHGQHPYSSNIGSSVAQPHSYGGFYRVPGGAPARPASRTGFSYGGGAGGISSAFGSPAASVAAPPGPLGPPGMTPMPPAPPTMGVSTPGPVYVDASLPRRSASKTPVPRRSGMSVGEEISGIPRPGSAADYFSGSHRAHGHRRIPAADDANAFYDPDTDPERTSIGSGASVGIRPRRESLRFGGGGQQPPVAGQVGVRPPSRASSLESGVGLGGNPSLSRHAPEGTGSRPPTHYGNIGQDPRPGRQTRPDSRVSFGNTPYIRSSGFYE